MKDGTVMAPPSKNNCEVTVVFSENADRQALEAAKEILIAGFVKNIITKGKTVDCYST